MNILFDLDGTLTDPFEGITKCISYALSSLGRTSPPAEDMKWCIGPPLKKSFSLLLASDDDQLAEKALTIYRERFSSVGLFENEIYQDIPEVLKTLKGMGHTLYVATSKPTVYAQRIIEHFGLLRNFRRVYGSELDGTRCDKSSLISYILQKEMIPSSETFMVGDREYDIIGAMANGVYSIGVLWGYGTKKELDNSNANACIRKPKALVPLMKKMILLKKTGD
ncbi:MAG: HAD hydrolase-like protein [Proteobacteria bacterium]|nr:HAD hydrolase-like protein [Pseudomonadota bacterium]MBU1581535.1 HAD hydrolase-like protein [Pseudomonadota bacterium]MBU2630851.1 HAD hydrolase-like protein [Pseudomonadota bacterium]